LARYSCAVMVMLITLQRGDCTPREGARLSKIAHIRCAVDKGSRRTPLAPVQEHSATKGTRVFVSRFTAVNADRGKLLSYGYPAVRNFSPAKHRAAFFELLVARENHTIFRASTFIACLTSTQVPRSARQFMHDGCFITRFVWNVQPTPAFPARARGKRRNLALSERSPV
jgi:hypothetical protein